MVRVKIGTDERLLADADPRWINDSVNNRLRDGQLVCAQVFILAGDVDMLLSTPACANGGGGGGRVPNRKERQIFDLWIQSRLSQEGWKSGNLVGFVEKLRNRFPRL